MFLLHGGDLFAWRTNALVVGLLPLRSYILCNHFLYMSTVPAFPGPVLGPREPFHQGYHPSYGTVYPPVLRDINQSWCWESEKEVNLSSLHPSFFFLFSLRRAMAPACSTDVQIHEVLQMVLLALESQQDHTSWSGIDNTSPFFRGKTFSRC